MRVTHVITRLIVGGAQENTIASVLGLRTKPGLQVELISGPTSGPEGSLESRFASCPEMLTRLPELVRPVHPWKDLRALQALTREFRARRPDLVHTHSGKAGVLGRLAARRAGVPLIVHTIHGPSFGPFQGGARESDFPRRRAPGRTRDRSLCRCRRRHEAAIPRRRHWPTGAIHASFQWLRPRPVPSSEKRSPTARAFRHRAGGFCRREDCAPVQT